jgi:hypothetical protein
MGMKLTRKGERLLFKILIVFLLVVVLASLAWGIYEIVKADQMSISSAFYGIRMLQS